MTRAHRYHSSLVAAVLAACTGAPPVDPSPEAKSAPPVAAPEAKADAVKPTPLADPPTATPTPAPPPEDRELPWKHLPAGVVPPAMVADITLITADKPILARARACNKPKLGGDCNYGGPEILGFHGDRVALTYPPESGHPEVWPLVGELVGPGGASRERETITQTGALEDPDYARARLKGWKWYARLAEAGWQPATPLVRAVSSVPHGDTGHSPVAFLKAPLAGWMLYVVAEGDALVVRLVAPDNKEEHRLGTLPIEAGERCIVDGAKGPCPEPRKYALASVRDVALAPSQRNLVALLSLSYGTGDEVDRTVWRIWPLPPGVLPAAP
jgi:hypothetical protein